MRMPNEGPSPQKKFHHGVHQESRRDHRQLANFHRLQQERAKLPIYPAKRKLEYEIRCRTTVIVIGETGSGKTTQIPQYLYEVGVNKGAVIAVTQPRRVAAITVAQRVAEEKNSELGKLVGYCVRFEDVTSETTKIKYMTDGMLLREAVLDPLIKRYTVVILDEAHERTIHTDVLFGVVKEAQKKRVLKSLPPLKIIVMSATMDVDHFSKYFNNAPVLYLEGRQFPIQVNYTTESQNDYLFAALVTVFQIHREVPPNEDILVFLTGQEEIDSMVKSIRDIARDMVGEFPPIIVCPLYAALPSHLQLRVFQNTPRGSRKIVVATNIAETSVTIHGIKYVVDTGVVKAKLFNPSSGLDLLKVVRVSKSQALQRTGRAGREAPGVCYRIYMEEEFDRFQLNTVPEIQRCNLNSVVLQLLALGITDLLKFDFMDKPSNESIIAAMEQLRLLGAVEKNENIELTQLGRQMAAFPLDPRLSKCLLVAKDHHCLEEMLTVVSILSVESVLFSPQNKRDEAFAARKKFMSSEGDHVTLLNIFRAYRGVSGNKEWCFENFINARNVKTACDVRKQLYHICERQKLPIQSCGQDSSSLRYVEAWKRDDYSTLVKKTDDNYGRILPPLGSALVWKYKWKCLTAGFFMNAAELQRDGEYVTLSTKKAVSIHPSSVLFMCKPAYVIFNELIQTSKCYMRDLSVVDPDWLYDAAPGYFKRSDPNT